MKKEIRTVKKSLLIFTAFSLLLIGQHTLAQDKEIICEVKNPGESDLNYAKQFALANPDLQVASQNRIHVIDIAFLYARSVQDKNTLIESVQSAILKTNMIFICSGVNTMFRAVAIKPASHYGISISRIKAKEALKLIQNVSEKVRSDYGADLIYGLLDNSDKSANGLSQMRGEGVSKDEAAKSKAVGLIIESALRKAQGHTLTHEIGHNLGLQHQDRTHHFFPKGPVSKDELDKKPTTPFVPFGKAYSHRDERDERLSYGTLMAAHHSSSIPQFSSATPDSPHGYVIGSKESNAVAALFYTIEDASNYSPTKIPVDEYKCPENTLSSCLQKGRSLIARQFESFVQNSGDLPLGFHKEKNNNSNTFYLLGKIENVSTDSNGELGNVFYPWSQSLHWWRTMEQPKPSYRSSEGPTIQSVDWVAPGLIRDQPQATEDENKYNKNSRWKRGRNIFKNTLKGSLLKINRFFK